MKRWLAMAFAHRLPLLFCGGVLLAGSTAALYSGQLLGAAETELAALQKQAARTTQGLAELRSAAAALDGLVTTPVPGDVLAGIASAQDLSFEPAPEQETVAGRWRASVIRLHGVLLHEEILLDIVDRWSRQSAFQHQVRHCALHRQAARLFADCQLVQLLPTGPAP